MKSNRGFSLIEILVGITLTAVIALGVGNIVVSWGQLQQRQNLSSALNQNRINIQNAVDSDIIWAKNLSANATSFACIYQQNGCLGINTPIPIPTLIDINSESVLYNGVLGNFNGYNLNGSPCVSNCPIQLQLTWLPQCNLTIDPGCKAPFIRIQGTYLHNASQTNILNWDKYNFSLVRQSITASPCTNSIVCAAPQVKVCSATGFTCVSQGCAPVTSSWIVGGNTCAGSAPATAANTDSVNVNSTNGFNGSAIFHCTATGDFSAAANLGATCVPVPSTCPAQILSWSIGAANCQATIPATAAGGDSALTPSTSGDSGQASFHCDISNTFNPVVNAGATCAVVAANGVCGPINNTAVAFTPTVGLCTAGTASAVAWGMPPTAPMSWTCAGSLTTASCSAQSLYTWAYCFVPGTRVTLKSKEKKLIENIEVGAEVQTYDEKNQQMTFSTVSEVFHHEEKLSQLYTFYFNNDKLTSNEQHRYYLALERAYFSAEQIYKKWQAGEKIILLGETNKLVTVQKIQYEEKRTTLYNLHVKGRYDQAHVSTEFEKTHLANHNYFANGILVHNVKWCGGQSSNTDVATAAASCDVPNDICNFGTNIMHCSFQTQADKNNFNSCGSTTIVSPTVCPGPPF